MFKHLTLSFIRFHSQPRRLATATAITVYICLNRPLPGAPLGGLPFYSTHNTCLFGLIYKTTAPVLVSYGLLPHPSLGSGNFHCRASTVVPCGFMWCPTSNFLVWFFVVATPARAPQLPKNPRQAPLALAPADSATTSTFRTRPPFD